MSPVLHQAMIRNSNYSPQVIVPIEKIWFRHRFPKLHKFRTIIVLVDIVNLRRSQFLLLDITRRVRGANYIFANTADPYDRKSYDRFYDASAPTKLVLITDIYPGSLFIPCIPCYSETMVQLNGKSISRQNIDITWNTLNLDLHGRLVMAPSGPTGYDKKGICRATLKYFEQRGSDKLCMGYILREKFNFTLMEDEDMYAGRGQYLYGGYFSSLLNGGLSTLERKNFGGIFGLSFEKFEFSVVTEFPSMANSFATFLLPFDTVTWILIVVSIITISCLLPISVSYSGFEYRFVLRGWIQDQIYAVFCLLLGQSGAGDVTRVFGNKGVAVLTSSAWLFGCYILMENLYQGSIFSYLTVPEFPIVPKTMNELLSSRIPVMTTSFVSELIIINSTTDFVKHHSILKLFIIPKIRRVMAQNSEYKKSLDLLQKRLFLIHYDAENLAEDIVGNISKSTSLTDRFETSATFALMSASDELRLFTEPIKLLGGRFVVDGRDDTGFYTVLIMSGYKNFIFPRFYSTYRRLFDSGLLEVWERLSSAAGQLSKVKAYGEKMYKRHYTQVNGGIQFKPEFHECMPVSGNALKYAFAISGALLCVGAIIFGVECMSKIGRRRNWW